MTNDTITPTIPAEKDYNKAPSARKEFLKKAIFLNNQITNKKDGHFFDLEKDKEAIACYEQYVDANFQTTLSGLERIKDLEERDYYFKDLRKNLTDQQVKEIIDVVNAQNFQWKSYMSITKFYDSYALKTDCGNYFLERYQDRAAVVAIFLARGDFELAKKLAKYITKQIYQPATPTFSNAGKKRSGELISCFLIDMDDSLNSINYVLSTCMQLSKIGGGVAVNLSNLRAKGAAIKNVAAAASGVIPILKILENIFDYADQLGVRRGSGAVYLSIFHLDLVDFLDSKKINADEKSRIQTLSIGLLMPDKFIELAKEDKDFYMFEPHTVFKSTGQYLSDLNMNEWYDKLVADESIMKRKLNARFILNKIAKTQFESGYPYIVFIDKANQQNHLKGLGKIKMSNLCTEIFQLQQTSIINDYGVGDEIKYDVSCTLGSLNLVNLMDEKDFEGVIEAAMRALCTVINISDIKNAPGVNFSNRDLRSVGLGAMNLAGLFIKNRLHYHSPEALEMADCLFAAINFYTLKASCKIAKETKSPFKGFEKSDYAKGIYFETYLNHEYLPKIDRVKEIFKDIKLPTIQDWADLKKEVQTHGIYNAYRMAIAPTQSISYLHGSTASIAPIVDTIEIRMYGNSITYFPMPFLSEENAFYYTSAYKIDQTKIIDLVAAIQKHVDQGISTVIFVTNQTTTREMVRLYLYAHHKNLKSLYYTRTKNLEVQECIACAA